MGYNELLEYLEKQDMTPILVDVVCDGGGIECSIDDGSCEVCSGHVIISELDDQLCDLALNLMKKTVEEWRRTK